jgi:hypothetical protein
LSYVPSSQTYTDAIIVFEGWFAVVVPQVKAIDPSLVARIEYVLLEVGGYNIEVSFAVLVQVPELFQPPALVPHKLVVCSI